MKYIFFIASFNAFFFLVLLFQKKPKALHDRILLFWLLYLGLSTAIYAFFMDSLTAMPLLTGGIIALFLLHGPFLYLYVSALTFRKTKFRAKTMAHFVPFVAFIIYLGIASQFPVYAERIEVGHTAKAEPPFLFLFFLIITALSGPLYFFLAQQQFVKSKNSNAAFSSEEINPDWLTKLIPSFGIIWILLILIAVIHHSFHLFTVHFCLNGLFLALSVFIILIAYFGLKQKGVFIRYATKEPVREDPSKYAASKLEGAELQQCCDKVSHYMKVEKPYLDSDLTLPKLAEGLNVSTHHLSQIINEVHEKNFFNFINEYRVEEVKKRISDPQFQNYSLLGIALESGFNSKSAFNRVFKKITGHTPSQFRNSRKST